MFLVSAEQTERLRSTQAAEPLLLIVGTPRPYKRPKRLPTSRPALILLRSPTITIAPLPLKLMINQPTLLNAMLDNTVNVSCNGGSNGQINVSVNGGTPAYTYLWNTGATTEDLTALMAGTYTVTITDANSCTAVLSANVTQPAVLGVTATATPGTLCTGGSSNLSATGMGGTGTLTYAWNNGLGNGATKTVSPTATTTYTVTVTDANNCTAVGQVTVTVAAPPTVTAGSNSPLCIGGTILLTATGGNSYSWSGPNGFTSTDQNPTIANATTGMSGTYTVTVTDGNGCTGSAQTTVSVVPQATIATTVGPGN